MGAGASAAAEHPVSTQDVDKWSKEEVGKQVAAIGKAFEPYKDVAIENGIDGKTLLGLTDEDLADIGVDVKFHRKKILASVEEAKGSPAAVVAPQPAAPEAATVPSAKTAAPAPDGNKLQLFLSYPRGDHTTPFARKIKAFLEGRGFAVWMDEQGIAGGVDFMSAIGDAIVASQGVVAIIDEKFCGSTYCNNELAMAQGNNLQLFPILFRGMSFDALPNGLKYMLASINVIPFPDAASDEENLTKLHDTMRTIFDATTPLAGPRRHGDSATAAPASNAGDGEGNGNGGERRGAVQDADMAANQRPDEAAATESPKTDKQATPAMAIESFSECETSERETQSERHRT